MSIILPRDDARCGWYRLLNQSSTTSHLKGNHHADVVIVGSGFVGLSAAREYAHIRPDHRVILIDALKIGQGASGRNSGFLIDLPHKRDLEDKDLTRKKIIYELNLEAINDLKNIVKSKGIDCQWNENGKYQVAIGERGEQFLNTYRKLLDEFNYTYETFDKESLSKVLGTKYYSKAIYTKGTVLMQPAALVIGLSQTLPDNVEIYEETPLLKINKLSNGFNLTLQDGIVKTNQIILANNIFAKEFGFFSNQMIPTMTYASITKPLSDEQMSIFRYEQSWGLTPADHGGTTMRLTPDKRLLIRNQYTYVPKYHDDFNRVQIRKTHEIGLKNRYQNLDNLEIEYTWGGACALSRNYQPFFGEISKGIYYSGIHQSVGATRGTITGKLLAQMALKQSSQSLSNMLKISIKPSINPPEIILNIGVKARMAIAKKQSLSEF